ncbi:UNVERIFIED_CONTAM: hypothetical protein FKN15_050591 [Acipenser sinensis]
MSLTAERHSVPLNDGNTMPLMGIGTYADPKTTPKGLGYESVKLAIDVGYRHIDGALVYFNEHEVGQAIREKIAEGKVKREDIFYCGKAMEACKDAGLTKSIGVSNFNRRQLELILNKPGLKHRPVSNQVECHPYFTQPKLLEYCRQKDIVILGYSPLGTSRDESWVNLTNPPLLKDDLLISIGKKYNKTAAQIALRFNVQRGVGVIPKSFNPDRIKENFQFPDNLTNSLKPRYYSTSVFKKIYFVSMCRHPVALFRHGKRVKDDRKVHVMKDLSCIFGFLKGDEDSECWPMESPEKELKMEPLLCDPTSLLPALTLSLAASSQTQSPALAVPILLSTPPQVTIANQVRRPGLDSLQLPPTPPSSHGSDSEGGQSPTRSCPPPSSTQSKPILKVAPRAPSSLTNSPLLTAPHKLQGSGPLMLTEEEKRTLIAEGYPVPTKLPLSKAEEKALKKIRRKIKNKISAQESRRKKKEYMDTLEKKVETCSNENSKLRCKVETLESTNRSLLQQLQCLQAVVAGKVPRSCRVASTQTGTCLMVVMLCFAVFLGSFSPSFGPCSTITTTGIPSQSSAKESYTATVRSRSLLGYEERSALEELHPSVLSVEYTEAWDRQKDTGPRYTAQAKEPDSHAEYLSSNDTQTEKSILIDLHPHSSEITNTACRCQPLRGGPPLPVEGGMDPLAKACPVQGELNQQNQVCNRLAPFEAAGGEGDERRCSRNEARGGEPQLGPRDMEESLEEKLKELAFRKQTSYSIVELKGHSVA